MNNKICCLVLVLIIILLIVKLTKIEKFDNSNLYYGEQPKSTDVSIPINEVKSVVSKVDGAILNIETNEDLSINIPVDNKGQYLGLSDSGVIGFSENKYNWKLNFIENSNDLNILLDSLGRTGYGQKTSNVSEPYYIVTATNNIGMALQCSSNKILASPLGNYDSQKWDVSKVIIPRKQIILRDIYETPIGQLESSSVKAEKDRIKINLNINDDKLKQLLNLDNNDPNNTEMSDSNEKCDTYMPKSAIESLCPGCDY